MLSEQLSSIKARKNFYQGNYHKACNALIIALGLIAILSGLLVYLFFQQSPPDFYATSMDGKLLQLIPLNIANETNIVLPKNS